MWLPNLHIILRNNSLEELTHFLGDLFRKISLFHDISLRSVPQNSNNHTKFSNSPSPGGEKTMMGEKWL